MKTKVKLILASDNDKGFTVSTNQFPHVSFDGPVSGYYLEMSGCPVAFPMHLSRNGKTLYTGKLHPFVRALVDVVVGFPTIGSPVEAEVKLGRQIPLE